MSKSHIKVPSFKYAQGCFCRSWLQENTSLSYPEFMVHNLNEYITFVNSRVFTIITIIN